MTTHTYFPVVAGLNLAGSGGRDHLSRTVEEEGVFRGCRSAVESSDSPCTSQAARHGGGDAGAGLHVEFYIMGRRAAKWAGLKRVAHNQKAVKGLSTSGRPSLEGQGIGFGSRTLYAAFDKDNGIASTCRDKDELTRASAKCFQGEPSLGGRHSCASATLQRDMGDIRAGLPSLGERNKLEEESRRKTSLPPDQAEFEVLMAHYVPVYVMLPLDCMKRENMLSYPELLMCNLRALRAAGVDGVMVDVWWGIVEADGPKQYNWSAYKELFGMIHAAGLKVQVVMSFHQCGGNTGDSCYIPLPPWVLKAGEECQDIFFTNQDGKRNQEYLSFGIDEEPVLKGRTGVQVYYDFMKSFRDNMMEYLEAGLVSEIEVGLGPAGELRYPSYPETHGWRFPGIGEFQCYDKFLLAQLRDTANSIGHFEWGLWGPHDAGRYNDWPDYTGFFGHSGSFNTDYGRFFLEWYSTVLLKHGDRILEAAADVFAGCKTKLAAKVAGVHWWYNSKNHAAELAAGYYNLRERDGYRPIAKMLARHYATLNFTCIEMRNDEQHWEAQCGPEGLVNQVLNAGWQEGLEVACENALPRYDWSAFDKIVANARPDGISREGSPKRRISAFTFLRLGPDLLQERHWNEFVRFVRAMHAGQDYHPEPEQFWRPRSLVRRSKPVQALAPGGSRTPGTAVPLIPAAPAPESESFFSRDAPGGGLGVQLGEIPAPVPRNVNGPGASQDPQSQFCTKATQGPASFTREASSIEGMLNEDLVGIGAQELEERIASAQLDTAGTMDTEHGSAAFERQHGQCSSVDGVVSNETAEGEGLVKPSSTIRTEQVEADVGDERELTHAEQVGAYVGRKEGESIHAEQGPDVEGDERKATHAGQLDAGLDEREARHAEQLAAELAGNTREAPHAELLVADVGGNEREAKHAEQVEAGLGGNERESRHAQQVAAEVAGNEREALHAEQLSADVGRNEMEATHAEQLQADVVGDETEVANAEQLEANGGVDEREANSTEQAFEGRHGGEGDNALREDPEKQRYPGAGVLATIVGLLSGSSLGLGIVVCLSCKGEDVLSSLL